MVSRLPIQHSMLRRCNGWDYCAPRIYMITITLADRRQPLLGELVVASPTGVRPEEVCACIQPSALGKMVKACWNTIPVLHPQIRLIGFQLMEEHLHGILQVLERLERPLGNVIGSFKAACTTAYRQLFPGIAAPLFSPGFQDTILSRHGQLRRMLDYLADNPRRAAIKRFFPDFFRHLRTIPFGGGAFTGIGNPFLLDGPVFHQVQASRGVTEAELQAKRQEMMRLAQRGAIVVSPCISPGERQLARSALAWQMPLIVLQNKGFGALYKPPGEYFDACAAGRLLMLAPSQWPFVPGRKPMTRWDACVLNALAQQICGEYAAAIQYRGIAPANVGQLVEKAMRP